MTTIFNTSGRMINFENITHAQILSSEVLLNPVGTYLIRLTGEEAKSAFAALKSAGFIGNDDMLINPKRLVVSEVGGAVARLILDGYPKPLIVPAAFVTFLEPAEGSKFPALETSSSVDLHEKPARKKKGEA